jgi:hypothetical protein
MIVKNKSEKNPTEEENRHVHTIPRNFFKSSQQICWQLNQKKKDVFWGDSQTLNPELAKGKTLDGGRESGGGSRGVRRLWVQAPFPD